MSTFRKSFPDVEHSSTETYELIGRALHTRNKDIEETLVTLARSGGRLLRPAFFFLFVQLGSGEKQEKQQLLKITTSLEILHMATLIHGDVTDDSPLHRSAMTTQSQYGKDVAVYTDDLLFTEFFTSTADAMNGSEFMKINAQGMKRLLLGEFDQMSHRFDRRVSIPVYLRSVNGKTAGLFLLSCLEGVYLGHSSKKVQRLAKRIGRHTGIAFQVYDDILDCTADTETLKEPVLKDLSQGVYTLPLLFTYRAALDVFSPYLNEGHATTLEGAAEAATLVNGYHGVTKAQAFAKRVTNRAITDIQQSPDGTTKETLLSLTEPLLYRPL